MDSEFVGYIALWILNLLSKIIKTWLQIIDDLTDGKSAFGRGLKHQFPPRIWYILKVEILGENTKNITRVRLPAEQVVDRFWTGPGIISHLCDVKGRKVVYRKDLIECGCTGAQNREYLARGGQHHTHWYSLLNCSTWNFLHADIYWEWDWYFLHFVLCSSRWHSSVFPTPYLQMTMTFYYQSKWHF